VRCEHLKLVNGVGFKLDCLVLGKFLSTNGEVLAINEQSPVWQI
jgi:hypothetical protein